MTSTGIVCSSDRTFFVSPSRLFVLDVEASFLVAEVDADDDDDEESDFSADIENYSNPDQTKKVKD
jgi:hypothetical protein